MRLTTSASVGGNRSIMHFHSKHKHTQTNIYKYTYLDAKTALICSHTHTRAHNPHPKVATKNSEIS